MNYRSYTTDLELNIAAVDRAQVKNADGHNVGKWVHDTRVKMMAEIAVMPNDEMAKLTYAQAVEAVVKGPKSLVKEYDFGRTLGASRSLCGLTDPDMRSDEQKAARLAMPIYKPKF